MSVNIQYRKVWEEVEQDRPRDRTLELVQQQKNQTEAATAIISAALTAVVIVILGVLALVMLGSILSPKPKTSMIPPAKTTADIEREIERLVEANAKAQKAIDDYKQQHPSTGPTGRFHYSFSIPGNAHGFEEVRGVRRYSDGRVEPFSRRQSW